MKRIDFIKSGLVIPFISNLNLENRSEEEKIEKFILEKGFIKTDYFSERYSKYELYKPVASSQDLGKTLVYTIRVFTDTSVVITSWYGIAHHIKFDGKVKDLKGMKFLFDIFKI